jgi:small-conductance mechanosensitive channel
MYYPSVFKRSIWLILFCLIQVVGFAQKKKKVFAHDSVLITAKQDTVIFYLINKIAAYTLTIDRNNAFIDREINTEEIIDTLPGIENQLKKFKARLESGNSSWNLRGLNSTTILLKGVVEDLTEFDHQLEDYSTKLSSNNKALAKILNDSVIHTAMPNQVLQDQMDDVSFEAYKLDSIQKNILTNVNILRKRVVVALLQANDIVSDLGYMTTAKKRLMWNEEEAPLFAASPISYKKALVVVTDDALIRLGHNLSRYCKKNLGTILISVVLFVLLGIWNYLNLSRIKKKADNVLVLQNLHFNVINVWVAGLFGLFMYAPLFFANPTMSVLHTCEFFRTIFLTIILIKYLTQSSKIMWIAILALWLLYAIDDVFLESAYGERWLLFWGSIVLIVVFVVLLLKKKHFIGLPESPITKILVSISLLLAIGSFVCNILGRVTLTKILGETAIQSLVLGISLKIFCALIIESIYMQAEAQKDGKLSSYIDFEDLKVKFKRNVWIVAIILWLLCIFRSITLYDFIKLTIINFFTESRTIGSLNFTLQNVAIFIIIVWISMIVSKFIHFLFGQRIEKTSGKRSSLGSMILLVRLTIWTIGFFIAIAASGIPIDKLSIMIGALSVGIGFGLQTIVNNLVSGIILAFEQPIQVGDQIEVGTKSGVVKEIGVRSSTIRSGDGADIIIPNGDLLSQHLINWTLQNRNRRVEFTIGISYLSNIGQAKAIIENTLAKNDKILHVPAPSIIVKELGEKAVDMSIMFWVPDLSTAGTLRSIAMISIYEALKAEGIFTKE